MRHLMLETGRPVDLDRSPLDHPTGHRASSTPDATRAVLVAGTGPVYGHGLTGVLQSRSLRATFLRHVTDLEQVLDGDARLVVVLERHGRLAADLIASAGFSKTALAVLLAGAETQRYASALALRAVTAVPADADVDVVVEVLVAAASARTSVPVQVARSLYGTPSTVDSSSLPAAHVEWLVHLRDGGTVAGLARQQAYSEREMYRQLGRLYRQLGATTRTGALLQAQRSGLLDAGTAS